MRRRRILPSAGIVVIGGGIVGLAVAYNLLGLYPGQDVNPRVFLLEHSKEKAHSPYG